MLISRNSKRWPLSPMNQLDIMSSLYYYRYHLFQSFSGFPRNTSTRRQLFTSTRCNSASRTCGTPSQCTPPGQTITNPLTPQSIPITLDILSSGDATSSVFTHPLSTGSSVTSKAVSPASPGLPVSSQSPVRSGTCTMSSPPTKLTSPQSGNFHLCLSFQTI